VAVGDVAECVRCAARRLVAVQCCDEGRDQARRGHGELALLVCEGRPAVTGRSGQAVEQLGGRGGGGFPLQCFDQERQPAGIKEERNRGSSSFLDNGRHLCRCGRDSIR